MLLNVAERIFFSVCISLVSSLMQVHFKDANLDFVRGKAQQLSLRALLF